MVKKTSSRKPARLTKKAASKSAKAPMKKVATKPPAKKTEAGDWRVRVLARVRKLIQEADPGIVEEVKWRKPSNPAGVPVWSHGGIICTGETYKNYVKLTFMNGAALRDPAELFNAGLGGVRRAIDIHEGDQIDEPAFKNLVRAAVTFNLSGKKK